MEQIEIEQQIRMSIINDLSEYLAWAYDKMPAPSKQIVTTLLMKLENEPIDWNTVASRLSPTELRVAKVIRFDPCVTDKEVAKMLGLSVGVVNRSKRRIEEKIADLNRFKLSLKHFLATTK